MDSGLIKFLAFAVIVSISAISGWLKKRAAEQERKRRQMNPSAGTATRPNQPVAPPQPARPASWEEELRRLLEGNAPAAPPPPVAPPVRPVSAPPSVVVRPLP